MQHLTIFSIKNILLTVSFVLLIVPFQTTNVSNSAPDFDNHSDDIIEKSIPSTTNNVSNIAYTIIEERFQYQEDELFSTDISYPQITGMQNLIIQNKINNMILNSSKRYFDEEFQNFLEISYLVKLSTDSVLSIAFERYQHYPNTIHPIVSFYCVNIDLLSGEYISVNTIYGIDDKLLLKIVQNKYFIPGNLDTFDAYTQEMLKSDIERGINDYEDYDFYFTASGLGVSFGLTHVLGSHIEFEIPYEEIAEWKITSLA